MKVVSALQWLASPLVFENPASVKEMTNMRYGSMSSMVPTTSSESFGRFSQTYVAALSISGHCFQDQDYFRQVMKSAHFTIVRKFQSSFANMFSPC